MRIMQSRAREIKYRHQLGIKPYALISLFLYLSIVHMQIVCVCYMRASNTLIYNYITVFNFT